MPPDYAAPSCSVPSQAGIKRGPGRPSSRRELPSLRPPRPARLPAGPVPVPTLPCRRVEGGPGDHMRLADPDLVVAARAAVHLGRLHAGDGNHDVLLLPVRPHLLGGESDARHGGLRTRASPPSRARLFRSSSWHPSTVRHPSRIRPARRTDSPRPDLYAGDAKPWHFCRCQIPKTPQLASGSYAGTWDGGRRAR